MGRKTKLTTEVHNTIITAIRGGNWVETAARYAGIAPSTLYNWLERGETAHEIDEEEGKAKKAEQPFLDFWRDYTRARAEAEYRNVQNIQVTGAGYETTRTTTKEVLNSEGEVVSLRTTVREYVRDWRASAWWLSKSFPERYGNVEDGHEGESGAMEPPPPVTFIEEDASGGARPEGEGENDDG